MEIQHPSSRYEKYGETSFWVLKASKHFPGSWKPDDGILGKAASLMVISVVCLNNCEEHPSFLPASVKSALDFRLSIIYTNCRDGLCEQGTASVCRTSIFLGRMSHEYKRQRSSRYFLQR